MSPFYPKQPGAFADVTHDIDAKTIWKCQYGLKGEQELISQSDLSWVFFEGDRSVEDDLKGKKKKVQHYISFPKCLNYDITS